jgi:hypothetical protein
VARAKHTDRAEARRRYRQTVNLPEVGESDELDAGAEPAPATTRPATRTQQRPAAAPTGRPGFLSAFRGAYHSPHVREDIGHWRELVTSRALLAALGLIVAAAVGFYAFPGYTGSTFAWELIVLPGQALAPQLVAGFFAPRASYLLGLVVGLAQGIVFASIYPFVLSRLGNPIPSDQIPNLLTLSFITGPISGMLFASAAAWYRRFLAMSSPRKAAPAKGRQAAKGNPSRRPAGR